MGEQPDIGWCPSCNRPVVEIPHGTCSDCACHTMTLMSRYAHEELLSASKAREAALREKLEAAEALSVTKILLRVEPDLNGHGSEVYASSVADVVDELGRIDEALETAEDKLRAAEAARTQELAFKNSEIADLRDKKFAKFNNEDCWIFQDDGADELHSLVCPVVINPARLIELLAAETRIKASQEQEPVAIVKGGAIEWLWCKQFDHGQLYAQPPIPPELAELQRDKETAMRLVTKTIAENESVKRENAELRKLLEESKVPEGWSISKLKTCYTLSHGNEVIATLAGPDAEKHAATIAAMLSAQPKEPKQ